MNGQDRVPMSSSGEDPIPRASGRLRVDGAELHYELSGRGPVIVFAHGLGGNHMSWWQQVAYFERSYTCVSFSHRGFFPSAVDAGNPDPLRYADDLHALLEHLRVARAHLVGQSMGGWTVVEFCLRHPGRVVSLVLSATTGSIDPARLRTLDKSALARWTTDSARTAQALRSTGGLPAAGARMATEQAALHGLYRLIDGLSPGLNKEAVRARLHAMRDREPSVLAATGVPVLLVSPDEDIVIAPPALRALAEELPGARLAIVQAAGHSPYFERASVFNHHLEAFFGSLGGGGGFHDRSHA